MARADSNLKNGKFASENRLSEDDLNNKNNVKLTPKAFKYVWYIFAFLYHMTALQTLFKPQTVKILIILKLSKKYKLKTSNAAMWNL